jgi:hypothetical protein
MIILSNLFYNSLYRNFTKIKRAAADEVQGHIIKAE